MGVVAGGEEEHVNNVADDKLTSYRTLGAEWMNWSVPRRAGRRSLSPERRRTDRAAGVS